MSNSGHLQVCVQRILSGESLESFGQWFVETASTMNPRPPSQSLQDWRQHVLVLARALWAATPVAQNAWRARGLPEVGRNDACYCGSGQKYKQCCGPLAKDFHLPEGLDMRWVTLNTLSGETLRQCARAMPIAVLTQACHSWNEQDCPQQTIEAVESLFSGAHKIDDRHEEMLDALLGAYLDLGQEVKRHELAARLSQHPAKDLAASAAVRYISMLIDDGNFAQAWTEFTQAKARNPKYIGLLYCEMTMLVTQGRQDEARLRAPLLAAQARKAGYEPLADVILTLGEAGLAGIARLQGEAEEFDEEIDRDLDMIEDWLSLIPAQLDVSAVRALHNVDLFDFDALMPGAAPKAMEFLKSKELADLDKRWRKQFTVQKPESTNLLGDADDCIEQGSKVLEFLRANPSVWFSWDIVDDIFLCVAELYDEYFSGEFEQAAFKLAQWVVQLLQTCVDETSAQLPWSILNNRPALRCLAQAIGIAQRQHREQLYEDWLVLGLKLNPNDNYGWRVLLIQHYMKAKHFTKALALAERYGDDMPPAGHNKALCLYALGKEQEAEQVLRAAHKDYPHIALALLPQVLDRPSDDGVYGVIVGGELQAWHYRMEMRPLWLQAEALDWLSGLELPKPEPEKASKPRSAKASRAKEAVKQSLAQYIQEDVVDMQALRSRCIDLARLHGLLCAIAWSPSSGMPGRWFALLQPLMKPVQASEGKSEIDAIDADLQLIMLLYNLLNAELIQEHPSIEKTWLEIMDVTRQEADGIHRWASGFVQGSELSDAAWKSAGHAVSMKSQAFAALMQLAALAPALSDVSKSRTQDANWRVTQDNGRPLLVDVNAQRETPEEQLKSALQSLWDTAVPIRQAQMHGL